MTTTRSMLYELAKKKWEAKRSAEKKPLADKEGVINNNKEEGLDECDKRFRQSRELKEMVLRDSGCDEPDYYVTRTKTFYDGPLKTKQCLHDLAGNINSEQDYSRCVQATMDAFNSCQDIAKQRAAKELAELARSAKEQEIDARINKGLNEELERIKGNRR